tara:strand:- start:42 stop:989 length:948 start_codon:yes stop_codon:yes gene_type:complete
MKNIINIFLLLIVITANSNAKITTVDDQFKLDLPLKHTYLNLERIDSVNELFDYDSIKSSGFKVYIVGNEKLMELIQTYIEGGDITKNYHIKNFIKKAERKASNTNLSEKNFYNWGIKEMKKTLKKMDISGFTFVLYNKDISSFDLDDLDEYFNDIDINELTSLTKQELKDFEKELKPYLKDILPVGPYSIKINSFKLSRSNNDHIYLSATAKISYAINEFASLKGDGIIYITVKDNSFYIFYEECLVNCKTLKKRFQKLIKPVVNQSSIKNSQLIGKENNKDNIASQLEQLNKLYKSGVLSKEEFVKAKKKILN